MNMSRAVHGAPLRADPAGVGRRRQQRRAVDWVAHCRTRRGDQWAVTIIDASEGGFGLSCTLPLPVDSRILVDVGGIGTFPCRIAWQAQGRCGLQLLQEEAAASEDDIDGLAQLLRE